jgi:hypothetical protein
MHALLAYAESVDSTTANLTILAEDVVILVGTAAVAGVLVVVALSRKNRRTQLIGAAAFFWALLTAGSLLYMVSAEANWSKEYTLRLETGYSDPRDQSDAPKPPWKMWTGLGIAYGVLMTWAVCDKR